MQHDYLVEMLECADVVEELQHVEQNLAVKFLELTQHTVPNAGQLFIADVVSHSLNVLVQVVWDHGLLQRIEVTLEDRRNHLWRVVG
jgi:hypothetical protein